MNIAGVGLASVTGLLAVWLWLGQSERVQTKADEATAELRCERARFDSDMARRWGDSADQVKKVDQREQSECDRFENKRTETETAKTAREGDSADLKNTIGSLMK